MVWGLSESKIDVEYEMKSKIFLNIKSRVRKSEIYSEFKKILANFPLKKICPCFEENLSRLSVYYYIPLSESLASLETDKKFFKFLKKLDNKKRSNTIFFLSLMQFVREDTTKEFIKKNIGNIFKQEDLDVLYPFIAMESIKISPSLRRLDKEVLISIFPSIKFYLKSKDITTRKKTLKIFSKIYKDIPNLANFISDMLEDVDSNICKSAAEMLANIGEESIPFLMKSCKKGSRKAKVSAVWALGKIGDFRKDVYNILINFLKEPDDIIKKYCMSALEKADKALLLKELENNENKIKEGILEILATSKTTDKIIKKVMPFLDSDVIELKVAAINMFSKQTNIPDEVKEKIVKNIKDNNLEIKKASIKVIKNLKINTEEAIENINFIIKNEEDVDTCCMAILTLGSIAGSNPEIISLIKNLLGKNNSMIRHASVKSLGLIGKDAKGVVKDLLRFYEESEDNLLKESILDTVGKIGSRESTVFIIELAKKTSNAKFKKKLFRALENADKDSLKIILNNISNFDSDTRKSFVKVLGAIGQPAIPAMIKLMKGKDPIKRQMASDALGIIGEPAISELINVLSSNDFWVRKLAQKALESMGDKAIPHLIEVYITKKGGLREDALEVIKKKKIESLPYLIPFVQSQDQSVAQFALSCLKKVDSKYVKIVPQLLKLLSNKQPFVREASVWALGEIKLNKPPIVSALKKLLDDPEERIRKTTQLALNKIGEK